MKTNINLLILIIFFCILNLWLIVFFVFELKRGRFKKDEKGPEVEKPEKKPEVDVSEIYLELKQHIDCQFKEFEKKIQDFLADWLKKSMPPEDNKRLMPSTEVDNDRETVESKDLAACIRLYNAAIQNSERQIEFERGFNPVRVDVANAMFRRRNPNLEPEFGSKDSGDFLVVEIEDDGSRRFAVFPRFGLTISEANYRSGAVGEVFRCPGFDSQRHYTIFRVISPAFFSREQWEQWKLIETGELELILEKYRNE
jgi:hypothetical protein